MRRGEALVAHGSSVGDSDSVELQMHFVGEVEGNLLGSLGLDHATVLLEDRVLEVLQQLGWF